MIKERVVIGRALGTFEWTRLVEYRDYSRHKLLGYHEEENRERFYLPDQVELRHYTDLGTLRIEIAKECLYNIIRHEGCADDRNVDHVTKENQVNDAIKYADLFIEAIQKHD